MKHELRGVAFSVSGRWRIALAAVLISGCRGESRVQPRIEPTSRATSLSELQKLRFDPNHGQFEDEVRFAARGRGHGIYLTKDGATLVLKRKADAAQVVIQHRVVGARGQVEPVGERILPGVSNYLVGDRSRWRTLVEGFVSVRYASVLPGVDLVYYGDEDRHLEYDFVVAPGTDPAGIAVVYEGASAELTADGEVVLRSAQGVEFRQRAPVAYQEDELGGRISVASKHVLNEDGSLGFEIGRYDRSRMLVIDPVVLNYSTYLGASDADQSYSIAVDADGRAYVTGFTQDADFPVVAPIDTWHSFGECSSLCAGQDVFVSRFLPSGALDYSTYLGGNNDDVGFDIAVDASGNAYVTGSTWSSTFPTTPGVVQPEGPSPVDGQARTVFVTKLNPSGSGLDYSTYLDAGDSNSEGAGIAVDATGSAHILVDIFDETFVLKLNPDASALVYGLSIAGAQANDIALDTAQNAYIVGSTSGGLPVVNAYQGTPSGDSDAFLTKVDPAGAVVLSTYFGGADHDHASGVAVDDSGCVYLAGLTGSLDLPTGAPAPALPFSSVLSGDFDAFVAKFATGSWEIPSLIYSTYLGGSDNDGATGIAIDAVGRAYVSGGTRSVDFPVLLPFQAANNGDSDGFVTALEYDGSGLVFSTYLGGNSDDSLYAIAASQAGVAHVSGMTQHSTNFPTANAVQATVKGTFDAVVATVACNGSSKFVITPANGISGAARLRYTVTGPGLPAPVTGHLPLPPSSYTFVVGELPCGSYTFSFTLSSVAGHCAGGGVFDMLGGTTQVNAMCHKPVP